MEPCEIDELCPSKLKVTAGSVVMPKRDSSKFMFENQSYLLEFPGKVHIGDVIDALMQKWGDFIINGIDHPIISKPLPHMRQYVKRTKKAYSEDVKAAMPDKNLDIVQEYYDDYFNYIYTRQLIWSRMKQGISWQAAAGDDPVLSQFKTLNAYRELNYNPVWELKNIIEKNKEFVVPNDPDQVGSYQYKDRKNVFWQLVVFRFFYNYKLYQYAGIPHYNEWNADGFYAKVIAYRTFHKGTPFTDVYTVTPPISEGEPVDTERYYVDSIDYFHKHLDEFYNYITDKQTTAEQVWLKLQELPIFGKFIAHEMYNDLTWAKIIRWTNNDFVYVGPGARFAIDVIFPNRKNLSYDEAVRRLWQATEEQLKKIGEVKGQPFPYLISERAPFELQKLTLKEIEDNLCQFSKYWRLKKGIGRPGRQIHEGTTKEE